MAKTATIKASGGFPAVGGTSTAAGTITIEQNGRTIHGMAKNNITVTEQVDPTTFAFEGTGRLFAPHWSTKQTFTGEFELQPDGSVQVTVEGDTISGTENRKGVTGVFQGTGSSPAVEPGAILTMNTEGTDKY